jgi:prevent-host-death family protein
MPKTAGTGVEEARNRLPKLLDAAERGQTTLITRRGRPVAALIPMEDYIGGRGQKPLLSLAGTGRGLWGKSSAATLDRLRDEWSR